MSTEVFFAKIPLFHDEIDLINSFSKDHSLEIVRYEFQIPKGSYFKYAVVKYATEADAEEAFSYFNESIIDDTQIVVQRNFNDIKQYLKLGKPKSIKKKEKKSKPKSIKKKEKKRNSTPLLDNLDDFVIIEEKAPNLTLKMVPLSNVEFPRFRFIKWPLGANYLVEFFTSEFIPVELISINDATLENKLASLVDGNPICLDLEWKPDYSKSSNNPISVYQFCSSKGSLLVHAESGCHTTPALEQFLTSNKFFGKGIVVDKKKLKTTLSNKNAKIDIEDIHQMLEEYSLPLNFVKLVEAVLGSPTASFKNKKVSVSDWSKPNLSAMQVLYAAFDVVAVYKIYYILK